MDEFLANARARMVADAAALIRIPSYRTASVPGAPFGEGPAIALRWILNRAQAMGFTVTEVSGVAGHIEIGEGDEIVGMLTHCDTVPPGSGWHEAPFGADVRGGRLYGRGACDNKGPLIASLYALLALRESGVRLKRRVRLIVGSDEESHWQCMEAYFREQPRPQLGFVPDGRFPVIVGEKGMLGLRFVGPGVKGLAVLAGEASNVVPSEALVTTIGPTPRDWFGGSPEPVQGGWRCTFHGFAAHASIPQMGENAAHKALAAVTAWGRLPDRGVLPFAATYLGDTYGDHAGIAQCDGHLGELTQNLGIVLQDETKGVLELDLRLPEAADVGKIIETMTRISAPFDVAIESQEHLAAHVVDPNSHLVRTLLQVYRDRTHDLAAVPLVTGGVTFARALGHAVAFGPMLPARHYPVHQPDEYFGIDDMVFAAGMYADALYRLAT